MNNTKENLLANIQYALDKLEDIKKDLVCIEFDVKNNVKDNMSADVIGLKCARCPKVITSLTYIVCGKCLNNAKHSAVDDYKNRDFLGGAAEERTD